MFSSPVRRSGQGKNNCACYVTDVNKLWELVRKGVCSSRAANELVKPDVCAERGVISRFQNLARRNGAENEGRKD